MNFLVLFVLFLIYGTVAFGLITLFMIFVDRFIKN